ncbi:MAG TPA: DUF5753 domain-containing protein [Actinomadura sp.]|nr:DUF5753 domain-containing protein [Actinomadura sp.]
MVSFLRADSPLHLTLQQICFARPILGDHTAMTRQLRRLLETAEYPNVTLQVLPFELGGHTGLDGSFRVLDFPHNKPVVYLDHKISGLFLEEPDQIAFFRHQMDMLLEIALSPTKSRDLIARIANEHERR